LERENFTYSDWTKGRFSEAVVVTGPARMIFLAGIGAEHEQSGEIQHLGDFNAQCRFAYEKLKRALERNGATMANVVKQVTYVNDVRFQRAAGECRTEAYAGGPLPAHTFLTISDFAWPGMLVEIDVIAMAPLD